MKIKIMKNQKLEDLEYIQIFQIVRIEIDLSMSCINKRDIILMQSIDRKNSTELNGIMKPEKIKN